MLADLPGITPEEVTVKVPVPASKAAGRVTITPTAG